MHDIAAKKAPYITRPVIETQNKDIVLAFGLIYAL